MLVGRRVRLGGRDRGVFVEVFDGGVCGVRGLEEGGGGGGGSAFIMMGFDVEYEKLVAVLAILSLERSLLIMNGSMLTLFRLG